MRLVDGEDPGRDLVHFEPRVGQRDSFQFLVRGPRQIAAPRGDFRLRLLGRSRPGKKPGQRKRKKDKSFQRSLLLESLTAFVLQARMCEPPQLYPAFRNTARWRAARKSTAPSPSCLGA